jgi:hypothetical protein
LLKDCYSGWAWPSRSQSDQRTKWGPHDKTKPIFDVGAP